MATFERALQRAVAEIVGATPMTREAIETELRARDLSAGDGLRMLLQRDARFATVEDGYVHVPTLFEGTTWTVWVDADDAGDDFVRLGPQLDPLSWWFVAAEEVPLVDETRRRVDALNTDGVDGDDVLVGPEGWLAAMAGGWATVRVIDGGLHWAPCPEPPDATPAQIAAVRAGYQTAARSAAADPNGPSVPPDLPHATIDATVYEAFVADRTAFVDPIPPLATLLEAAGLEAEQSIVAERDFDWSAYRNWQEHNRFSLVYGLDDAETTLLMACLGATIGWLDDGDESLGATDDERRLAAAGVAASLGYGSIAAAYASDCERRNWRWEDIARFAESLDAHLDGLRPIGLAWIRARGLDLAGDAAGAIAVLEQATADGDHEPALLDLAGFYADRGDAPAAYALLRRLGMTGPIDEDDYDDTDEAHLLLEEIGWFAQHRPRPAAGRNDRCPCGSGRKYKACHLGRERHSMDDRAGWLFEKARRFLRRRASYAATELAREMTDAMDDWSAYAELRGSPWIADLALHEGGVLAEFVAARDHLLPDDEALLAAQWVLVPRGVFEIRRVRKDGVELHDIGGGEDIAVTNITPNERMQRGTVLVGRPLPVGGTFRAFGGFMEIPRARVDEVLDAIAGGDPSDIVAVIGATMRPPELQNTEGQVFVLHRLRWRCPAGVDVGAALLAAGLSADDSGDRWTLLRDTPGQTQAVIAALRLDGDELIGEVNSDERAAELVALVAAALPGAALLDDDRRSMQQAMEDLVPGDDPAPLPMDPEVRAALAEIVAQHERRWLDESIPALGGRTPREAALDPVGREELEHLLDSFPPGAPSDDAMVMSVERLRDELGL